MFKSFGKNKIIYFLLEFMRALLTLVYPPLIAKNHTAIQHTT